MDPDLSALDRRLAELEADGYLLDADGTDADQRYLSGFGAPDAFQTLYTGKLHLLVSSLEYGRARQESRADEVVRLAAYDYQDRIQEHGSDAEYHVLASFLTDRDVESVVVPPRFPTRAADCLRQQDIAVRSEAKSVIGDVRARKSDEECDQIRSAQRANEAAMATAEQLLSEATIDGEVLDRDGEVLTSERVRQEIEFTLLRNGCALDETIVACGADAADPHDRGSGPLRPNEPIIVDIFPRDKTTRYHADMTRTFCLGEPPDSVREWYDLTAQAKEAALTAIEPGVTGAEVHDVVCDVYEDAGLATLRSDPETETGYIHSTGHGVGLEVHEQPVLSPAGDDDLKPGHVVTVEPGLYDPEVGGIRLEDLVVVTADGIENLTNYPQTLEVGDAG